MPLATLEHFRPARPVTGLIALLLAFAAAPEALAEPVTHTFSGGVTSVTDGTAGTLDLTGAFSVSQSVTFGTTIERSTAPFTQDAYTAVYQNAVTEFGLTVGTFVASGTGINFAYVTNDVPPGLGARPGTLGTTPDEYLVQVNSPIAPQVGDATLTSVTFDLYDLEGTAFSSTALPRVMPDLSTFEDKTFTLVFFDSVQSLYGAVQGVLDGVTTPALATSWGRLKGMYRGQ